MRLAVSTVCFDGYDLETAFKCLKDIDVHNVEIAYIDGYVSFQEEDLTVEKGLEIKSLLEKYNLIPTTVGAHIDFGHKDAVEKIKRRIVFTKSIGAPIVISNSCYLGDEKQFKKNIVEANDFAKDQEIIIALENTGFSRKTLCTDAKSLANVVKALNLSNVKANYDTANVTTHHWKNLDESNNLKDLDDIMCCLHLKDTTYTNDGCYQMCHVGSGQVDNAPILKHFQNKDIVITMEMPMRITWNRDHQPIKREKPLDLDLICKNIQESVKWFKQTIGDL